MKNVQDIVDKMREVGEKTLNYLPALFALFLLSIYGFLMYEIYSVNNQPVDSTTTATQTAKVPHISDSLIKQIQSLQDNSTSVRTLFVQARDNPFQE